MAKPQIQCLLTLVLVVTISIGLIHPFNSVIAQPAVLKAPNLKVELVAHGLDLLQAWHSWDQTTF